MKIRSVAAATLLSVPLALPAPALAAAPGADFDGDGYTDLAIGAPTDSVAGQDAAGAVNVIYGGPHGLTSRGNQEFTQASPGVGDTPELGDRFGAALAAGDFDGDGYADLAIGVPGEGVPSGVGQGEVARVSAGMVQVLYGSRRGCSATRGRAGRRTGPVSRARPMRATASAARSPPATSTATGATTWRSARRSSPWTTTWRPAL